MSTAGDSSDPLPTDFYDYGIENIQVLRDCQHIRRRPGMYLNGEVNDEGLHRLVLDLIFNSLDEYRAGFGAEISIDLLPDKGCRVSDHGRGFPVCDRQGTPLVGRIMTEVLTKQEAKEYGLKSGGHNYGIGLSGVNALSHRTEVEVAREGRVWRQQFSRGKPTSELINAAETIETGTIVSFWPDPQIFDGAVFQFDRLARRCRELAGLNHGSHFLLKDLRGEPLLQESCFYPNGLADYLRDLMRDKFEIHPTVFHFCAKQADWEVEVALQWTSAADEAILTFANSYPNSRGGTHRIGFLRSLTASLMDYGNRTGRFSCFEITPERLCQGLAAMVSVNLPDPQFESQNRMRLNNPDIESFVEICMNRRFPEFLRTHPEEADAIIGRILQSQ